jgi:hypothetical protein
VNSTAVSVASIKANSLLLDRIAQETRGPGQTGASVAQLFMFQQTLSQSLASADV